MQKDLLLKAKRQTILSMKLIGVLLFAASLQVSATARSQRISIAATDISLKEVFNSIKKQSGYVFFYKHGTLQNTTPMNISIKNAGINEVLNLCLKDQKLSYRIVDKTILIEPVKDPPPAIIQAPAAPIAKENLLRLIKGRVTDSSGVAIDGVSVTVKGTSKGTVTNKNGEYQVNVEKGDVLQFSYVGYEDQEVLVDNQSEINIRLIPKESSLVDIVVVGYGTQKKRDVTGAVSSVNEQSLKSVPTGNILSALQGQAPGIDIQKSGGNSHPGATPTISIRGQRSLGASNDVLYIVDGVPYNATYINDLNPNDVVSVDILKDASATAIYGSRGANGVILITTRKGKSGKIQISYNTFGGVTKPLGMYDIMDGKQYELYNKWATYNAYNPSTPNTPNPYNGIDDPKFYTDGLTFLPTELTSIEKGLSTDWQKLIFKNGFKTDHQITVSGGTENTQYAISGGFYNESGIFPGILFRRYYLKLSLDQRLSKYVKIGVSSINTISNIDGEGVNPLPQALQSSPLAQPYDDQGNLVPFPNGGSLIYNPLANLVPGAVMQRRKRFNTFTSAYAEVQITPRLKYRFNGGVQLTPETYGEFFASKTYQSLSGPSRGGNRNYDYYDYTLENLLVYDNTFAKDHHINFTGLFSFQEDYKASTSFSYNNILTDDAQYFNPALGANLSGSGAYAKFNIVSFMGRLNYNFKGKYLLTLTGRSDGSSTLAPGNKYHFFPSVAAGWNIMEENFLRNINAISNLKLRLSYGTVGNAAVNPYQTLGSLSSINYNYGSTNVTGTYPVNIPNPVLGWEYTETVNAGLDFGILKDRITGSVELYQQFTKNIILPQNLPITTGYSSQFYANVGKTENKGLEIAISSVNIKSENRNNFGWTTNLSVSLNRNKITALSAGVTEDIGSNRFVGYSINSLYNYKRLGIWQNTPEDSALAKSLGLTLLGSGSVIGTVKVADKDGNGVINADDRMIIGTRDPKFQGGITNRFSYRGIDLTVVASYRVGGLLLATQYQPSSGVSSFRGKSGMVDVEYWTPFNHQDYWPKPNFNTQNAAYGDLLGIIDASYLKIRTISLGYTIPQMVLDKIKLKSLRIYGTLNDAFVLFSPFVNKFNGIDPESAGSLGTGIPATKSLLFGLNISF